MLVLAAGTGVLRIAGVTTRGASAGVEAWVVVGVGAADAEVADDSSSSTTLCTFCAEDGGGELRVEGRIDFFFHSLSSKVCM